MKVELDWSSVRAILRTIRRYLAAVFAVLGASCRWVVSQLTSATRTSGRWLHTWVTSGRAHVAEVTGSRATRRLARRLSRGLVGVRRGVSALTIVAAPLLALVTGWWVARSYGFPRFQSWVVGTWTGTDPHLFVVFGVAVLVAVAAAFTIANSGLVPATVLVMGPLFGVGLARYGLTVEPHGTVGIPDAVASGGLVALAFGVPIGLVGFLVGTALRTGIAHFGEGRGLDGGSWQA